MLKLTTPCFLEGGWIPDYNAGFGEDQSPEFHIEGIDPKAETMVITLDDLGHPLEPGYNHWVAWNIKPADCIPGGIPKGSVIETPIHIEQGSAYGKHCYRGPKPPFNWNHVEAVEKDLDEAESQVLGDIEDMLNAQMVRYNDRVYKVRREAPTIKFVSKAKYVFHTPRDDGKGTAFKSLIVLDLSILEFTELPAIAHDSSIFKNIGDLPIDGIMDIYLESKKQIFIAFDKEGVYTKKVADAVTDTAVIKLGENGDQLFGWTWAIKERK